MVAEKVNLFPGRCGGAIGGGGHDGHGIYGVVVNIVVE